jgi:hypothetical protein
MIYRGQPQKRLARFLNRIVWLSAGWYLALVAPLVALADDSDTLQKQAIQRIDHYRDYVRHTGDVAPYSPSCKALKANVPSAPTFSLPTRTSRVRRSATSNSGISNGCKTIGMLLVARDHSAKPQRRTP